jgi:hypothetical protein
MSAVRHNTIIIVLSPALLLSPNCSFVCSFSPPAIVAGFLLALLAFFAGFPRFPGFAPRGTHNRNFFVVVFLITPNSPPLLIQSPHQFCPV